MHSTRLLCLVSILCSVSVSASAQQAASPAEPPTTSDPQAVALIQHALAALTGGGVSDVTLTGAAHRTVGSENEVGTATLTAMASAYSKMSLSLPSGPRMEIRNPSGTPLPGATPLPSLESAGPQPVGAWSGPDGVLHAMVLHNLLTDATWFFPVFTLSRLASSPAYIWSYVGQETHEGQPVLHVSACLGFSPDSNSSAYIILALQHLSQMDIYLDPTTLLPVSLSFDAHLENDFAVDIPIVRAQ